MKTSFSYRFLASLIFDFDHRGGISITARFIRAILLDTVLYSYLSRATTYINGGWFRNVSVDVRWYLPRLLLATSAPNDYSWNYTANLWYVRVEAQFYETLSYQKLGSLCVTYGPLDLTYDDCSALLLIIVSQRLSTCFVTDHFSILSNKFYLQYLLKYILINVLYHTYYNDNNM